MKKQLLFTMFIALFAMMFAACSSDELSDKGQCKALTFDASILHSAPMEISTRGISISSDTVWAGVMHSKEVEVSTSEISRAPLDDTPTWSGSEAVTVKVDGRYFQYAISGSGSSSTMTSASPYYFTTTNDIIANVWYPSSGAANKTTHEVLANQSTDANFKNSDFMYGSGTVSHANTSNSISMAHKIAKVRVTVNVVNPSYLNNSNVLGVTLCGTKLTSTVGSDGNLSVSVSSASDITMHQKSATEYEACIIPQTATLTFAVNVGGTTYTSTAVTSRAYAENNIYTASITITAQQLLYQGDGTVNVGDFYGTFANGQAVLIDGTTAAVAAAKTRGATPIAIVYSTSTSSTDSGHGWTKGYAFSLKDVNNSATYAWSTKTNATVMATQYPWASDMSACWADWDGYTATHRITDNGSNNATTYPAFFAAVNYKNTVAAPPTSSKWYLASEGQWYYLLKNLGGMTTIGGGLAGSNDAAGVPTGWWYATPNDGTMEPIIAGKLNNYFSVAGSGNYTAFPIAPSGRDYWSSSEACASNGVRVGFLNYGHMDYYISVNAKSRAYCVRAVLAF